MDNLPTKMGTPEMADLKHMTRDKRGRWQYRRHVPDNIRHRFKGAREFTRALPGPTDADRALQYFAAVSEFDSIAAGSLVQPIVPRAANPKAPPLSPQARQINQALAKMPKGMWPDEDPEPDQPPTVADAVKRFLDDPMRASTDKTKHAHTPRLETLAALLGRDKAISEVTKDDCRAAVLMLNELPREYRRRYAHLPPREAIERGKAEGEPLLSPKTRQHYIEVLRSFMAWCAEEDLIASSPAKALKAPKVKRNKDRQDAWTTAALNTLFAAPLYRDADARVSRPGAFWVPIIGLLQGMRLAEIVMLVTADVIELDGVVCFDIRERAGRTLKNEPSARTVPIHKELIRLGLLDYVRALPDGPLWPDLMLNKKGEPLDDPPDQYGKAFARQITALELDAPGRVFHALRHAFASACRAANMPDSARLYLGGWAQSEGVASDYGKHDIAALKRELDKVAYAGVTLPEPT